MSEVILVAIIVSVAPTITAIAGLALQLSTRRNVVELHKSTNSKMDQLLTVSRDAAYAEGKLAGSGEEIGKRDAIDVVAATREEGKREGIAEERSKHD